MVEPKSNKSKIMSKELVPLNASGSIQRVRDFLSGNGVGVAPKFGVPTKATELLYKDQVYPFVVVLIPAHNEENRIRDAVLSLQRQSRPPDDIIVIADNCTDSTVAIALSLGASVIETHENSDLKAGALNAVIEKILPMLEETDSILVMDADTILSTNFVRSALRVLFKPIRKGERAVAGVGGIFLGIPEKWSLIKQLQMNEYLRYQRRLARRRGRALVLTGTGTMFNIRALRQVVAGRKSGRFPHIGEAESVYDTAALTEDNELTLCAKRLNYRVLSPKECTVETATMPTFKSLYRQRKRWQRGALENLYAHGLDRHTAPYIIRQIITYSGVWFVGLYLTALSHALWIGAKLPWTAPLWLGVLVVYIIEQTFSVRKGGWRAMLTSALVVPELVYNLFLNFTYLVCLEGFIFAWPDGWGRMRDADPNSAAHINGKKKNGISHHKDYRLTRKGRIKSFALEALKDLSTISLFSVPFWNPNLAWNLIAGYVLVGSIATIARMIPVKTA